LCHSRKSTWHKADTLLDSASVYKKLEIHTCQHIASIILIALMIDGPCALEASFPCVTGAYNYVLTCQNVHAQHLVQMVDDCK
jgi:hypothetical protein